MKMLLSYCLFFAISFVFAYDTRRINDYIVKIDDNGNLKSIEATIESRRELDLSNLQIKEIGANAFSSNLNGLEILDLSKNKFKYLDQSIFKNLTNLRNLSLANNHLFDFEGAFVGLHNLAYLNLSNFWFPQVVAHGYLFGLKKTCVIETSGSRINEITPDAFEEIGSNKIGNGNDRHVDRHSLPKEEEKDWSNVRVIVCIKDDGSVERVELLMTNESAPSGCQIARFTRSVITSKSRILNLNGYSIKSFEAGWYRLGDFPIAGISLGSNEIANLTDKLFNELPKNIEAIDLSRNVIETLKNSTIENPHLRLLDLNTNRISHIDDWTFARTKLTSLNLNGNHLNSTNFAMTLPSSLTKLYLAGNDISDLINGSFERLDQLIDLKLDLNIIVDITEPEAFRGLSNLETLGLSGMNIEIIAPGAFRHLTKLIVLNLNNNDMENLRGGIFEGLVNLKELDLSYNLVKSMDCTKNGSEHEKSLIFNLPNLSILHLQFNRLIEIKGDYFEGLENLLFLDLSRNNIAKIGKNFGQNMPKLRGLFLPYNRIVHLESGTFVDSPKNMLFLDKNKISIIDNGAFKLPSLTHLELGWNKLTVIGAETFAGLDNLEDLSLWDNSITEISNGTAKYWGNLKYLWLTGNPLTILKNGALCGMSKTSKRQCLIDLSNVPLRFIEAGVFNC